MNLKSGYLIICISMFFLVAFAACDLMNADTQMAVEPTFTLCDVPGNASLTDTTWVSLPGQSVSGKMPELYRNPFNFNPDFKDYKISEFDVTYTIRITSDSLNHRFGVFGISIINHDHPVHDPFFSSGNFYGTYWEKNDESKPAIPFSNLRVRMSQMGVYHKENFAFVYAIDYKVQGNCLSILYGEKDNTHVLEFGLFSDEHELSEWYYNRYGRQ